MDGSLRLREKARFEELLRAGARRRIGGYLFCLGRREAGPPRLGILVSKKHSPLAVDRNRMKRCIREAFRMEQESLGAVDILVRPPYGVRPDRTMTSRVREFLRKACG